MSVRLRAASVIVWAAFGVFPCSAWGVTEWSPARLAQRFECVVVIDEGTAGERMLYGDTRGHLHLYRYDAGKPVLEWETTSLGSAVTGLVVDDIEGDGKDEIIVSTSGGRIFVYDVRSHDVVWESDSKPLETIRCMVAGDVDGDPQIELVFVAGSYLVFLDGITKSVEWRGEGYSGVRAMVLGNVDGDPQEELILSTGVVFDTRHHRVEFEGEESFGERIDLVDLTGDGIPEVIAEGDDSTLRVFDVYGRRELW